ncbi:hypothetical protein H2200_013216 [Cladophialophora chaetospira]|uniref:3-carboxymuconate cyclase n=1 Tax=Cladophialophora chaetospira TaxID=386627 RepID=A0AA39CBL0_9EURO|nr:hypothetical protein H2200_013216 [Cladophialophora chaetospira]
MVSAYSIPPYNAPPYHGPSGPTKPGTVAKAVYFMTNTASNAVVALNVAEDGTIANVGSVTPTRGSGGNLVNPTTFAPNGPDALGSQGSIQVLLFAVNPASNTLSLFEISVEDPALLTLVGEPVDTGGQFPVSAAVSEALRLVCVANTGAQSGVSCSKFDAKTGVAGFDSLRPIPLGQSSPPTGPANGIAQVLFNEDDSALVAVVKGNGTAMDPGFLALYPIELESGQLSYQYTKSSPAGAYFLFGSTLVPGTSRMLASVAGYGSAIIDLLNPGVPIASTNMTTIGAKAPCWAITSPVTGTGFIDDVLVSQLVEVDLSTGAIVSSVSCENNDQGLIDMGTFGDKIYALSPGNGTVAAAVTVFDISGGRGSQHSIQNFEIDFAGKNAEGLAIFY